MAGMLARPRQPEIAGQDSEYRLGKCPSLRFRAMKLGSRLSGLDLVIEGRGLLAGGEARQLHDRGK